MDFKTYPITCLKALVSFVNGNTEKERVIGEMAFQELTRRGVMVKLSELYR